MALGRRDLENLADLRRRAEVLCDEAQHLIDEAEASLTLARKQILWAHKLLEELNAAIAATQRRLSK
jgi:hypothetical protein